MYICNFF